MQTDPNVVDMDELVDRIGDDLEFAQELLQEFRAGLDEEMSALKQTLESGDPEQATAKTHALKGSALNLSAKSFASVARDMEEASKRGDVPAAASLFPDLQAEAERLKDAIDSLS